MTHGQRKDKSETGLGPFGIGDRNERGERLLEYVASRDLTIGNTWFEKAEDRYWTWESPNGETHNMIDYIICDNKRLLMDVGVITKVDVGSDHRFVRAKVRINKKKERFQRMTKSKKKHIDLTELSNKKKSNSNLN